MNTLNLLADLTETIAVGIPIVMLMIPIVAILTHHQRKMAEIIHGRNGQNAPQGAPVSNPEIAALRAEVYELKQMVQSQLIAMDTLQSTRQATPPPAPSIEQRLN
ncbi:MAG: hypothetical protein K1X67_04145 [Fimbriimonadaceae bacterium]|nr:hypothetical protein [Fimbriimonadaceae bacterium]